MPDPLNQIISTVISSPALHAKWLNTFSYLEYIGFRKIVKSQNATGLSTETLSHAVEEGRHALKLKKLAVKIGGKDFDNYDEHTLLCVREATNYFQTLDRSCEKALEDIPLEQRPRFVYLWVTWLVEKRALLVYELYQATNPGPGSLRSLLAEEENHLQAVESELRARDAGFEKRGSLFKTIEEGLYQTYIDALMRELALSETERAISI
jgi:hypothetical protein